MGGIYILDEFRGLSLANELVGYLVETAKKKNLKEVYCLPFEELRNFYAKFDFHEFEYEDSQVNAKVLEKFKWCLGNYEKQSFTIEAN
ncbi:MULTISPECIES: GNAT family N-acetyltransferase [Acinetobacter]|uniref:GNAT family N-acetyltransferase n=1 Tax=Acinetobacter TaxID=469 RepID=UPI001BB12301|nr:GNAT family N-acetyltransferase [Acinetobacter lwoffii]